MQSRNDQKKQRIQGLKIAVFRLGQEGLAAVNFLGRENDITIIDTRTEQELKESLKEVKVKFKLQNPDKIPSGESFDLLVRSPVIRPDHPLIKKLTKKGTKLTSVTGIFFDLCPCPIIGITGTKGKGTTTTLIHQMLKAQAMDAYIAGNIGLPAIEILPKLKAGSIAVLELSSFQLMDLKKSPHIAVVLMVTSEHLDWHTKEEEYQAAKKSIVRFQNQDDFAVINQDFKNSLAFSKETRAKVIFTSTQSETNGVFAKGGQIVSNIGKREKIIKAEEILLPGAHNLQNAAAATAVAKIMGVETQNIQKVLKNFKGLRHRLQMIRQVDGTRYYNDSFSTTPETTIAAVKALNEPKVLILGGSSKNSNFQQLGKVISTDKSTKALILIGEEAKRIEEAIEKAGGFEGKIRREAKDMSQIIKQAQELSVPGDIVILSPACASFDMFESYKQRGEQFEKAVNEL